MTLDELKEYKPENGELDDEQLEAVSGGGLLDEMWGFYKKGFKGLFG